MRRLSALCIAILCEPSALWAAQPNLIELPGNRIYPESLASTTSGAVIVGSIGEEALYRVEPGSSRGAQWIRPRSSAWRSVFGVFADEKSGSLWACSNDLRQFRVTHQVAHATLFQLDLHSGAIRATHVLPGEHAACNDIAVGADGTVYATDSTQMSVVRLAPGSAQLETWIAAGVFGAPTDVVDGLAFAGPDSLYVGVEMTGQIFRVHIDAAGKPAEIKRIQLDQPLDKPDGIRTLGPHSVLLTEWSALTRITFDGDVGHVERIAKGFNGAVSVTRMGNMAYVLQGQLNTYFGQTPDAKTEPFRLVGVPLP